MADIRINQLPLTGIPVAGDFVPIDNSSTRRATIQNIVEIGRPAASQAEAEAGTNPTKVMTPLTTKQSIASEVGVSLQAYDAGLTSIAGLTTAADQMIYTTGADAYATTALTPFARTLLDDVDAVAVRGTLGLGGSATLNVGTTAGTVAAGDDSRIVNALQIDTGKTSFQTKALAQAATIPAAVKRISFQFLNPTYASLPTLVGSGEYKRASLAALGSYPSSAYFRTVDRFMPDGSTDNTNGGYWLLDEEQPDPLQFGADGAGSANSYQAIVDAGTYASLRANSIAGAVFFNNGLGYSWNTPIVLPAGLQWIGIGRPPMKYTGATGVAVTVIGNNPRVQGFNFSYTGTWGNNVTAVQIGTSAFVRGAVVADNDFRDFYNAIYHKTGVASKIYGNYIAHTFNRGIWFANTIDSDAGDGAVYDNVFSENGSTEGTAAFYYESGGGLRFQFNKILGFVRGFDMQIADGAATVDLMFNGNSIENQSTAAMRLGRAGTTGIFGAITIIGNEFGGIPIGLDIGSGAHNISVAANIFNGGTVSAIAISGDCTNVNIGDNTYEEFPANISDSRSQTAAQSISQTVNYNANFTDAVTYSYYNTISLVDFRSVRVRVFIEGVLQGVGHSARNFEFLLSRNGSTITTTQIDNTTFGAAVDISIDTATSPGSARIGFRRNAAAGGTAYNGTYTLSVEGRIAVLSQLQ